MGRSPQRLDAVAKVTGEALYAADIRRPGLLYARILRPPAHGATLAAVDTSEATEMDGVRVVEDKGLVAVLHADPEVAGAALGRLRPEWNAAPPGADTEGIFDHLVKVAPEPEVKAVKGDVEAARAAASPLIEGRYEKGYVAHAPIEPHTATAEMKDGKLTVWSSTQMPFPTRDAVMKVMGLDAEHVRVITPYVGGGFGGKSTGIHAEEAARLARATGAPVQVAYTRTEEFFYDTLDPACVVRIASAVDGDGRMTLWDYEVYAAGDRAAELTYDVPHTRLRMYGNFRWGGGPESHRFGVGPWRAPGANMNVFARESHIDVLAAAAKVDPLEFRLRNMGDERMTRVLKAVAEKAGWAPEPGPSGRGRGIACGVDSGTYVALVAEVSVDREKGTVTVQRVVCGPGHGGGDQPRRGPDADGGVRHDGPGVRAQRGAALRRRADARRELRHLRAAALLVDAPHRDGPGEERRPLAAGRGRAGDHPHGRGPRQRGVRRHRGADHPAAHDPGAPEGRPRKASDIGSGAPSSLASPQTAP